MTHEELTGGNVIVRTVCPAVDIQGAGTADTLTAIVVERNRTAALATLVNRYRIDTLPDKLFIEYVEHLEERSIFLYT